MRLGWSTVRAAARTLLQPNCNEWRLVGFYSSVITMMHGPINIKSCLCIGYI